MSTVALLSMDEYTQMIRSGVFDGEPRRRIELIYRELRDMSPIGPEHAHIVNLLNRWSTKHVPEDRALVCIQSPIQIYETDSVPEPDIAWVVNGNYSQRYPEPQEVFLLIEVADSSLAFDMQEKARLYAKAKIADYWVVDIVHRSVEVFRKPQRGVYQGRQSLHVGSRVSPLAFPELTLSVNLLFD